MKKKKPSLLAVVLALLVVLTTGALAARATAEPYVLAVWEAPGGPDDHFAVPQVLIASQATSSTSLDALDGVMECGTTYQVDLYANDAVTAALLAGGVLVAPGNPRESWPGGRYQASFSKVVTTADCPVDPPVAPPTEPPVAPPTEPPVAPPATPVVDTPRLTG